MSTEFITIISMFTIIIGIAISRESVKPTAEINWRKMITLLTVGSIPTLVLTISAIQSLPFIS